MAESAHIDTIPKLLGTIPAILGVMPEESIVIVPAVSKGGNGSVQIELPDSHDQIFHWLAHAATHVADAVVQGTELIPQLVFYTADKYLANSIVQCLRAVGLARGDGGEILVHQGRYWQVGVDDVDGPGQPYVGESVLGEDGLVPVTLDEAKAPFDHVATVGLNMEIGRQATFGGIRLMVEPVEEYKRERAWLNERLQRREEMLTDPEIARVICDGGLIALATLILATMTHEDESYAFWMDAATRTGRAGRGWMLAFGAWAAWLNGRGPTMNACLLLAREEAPDNPVAEKLRGLLRAGTRPDIWDPVMAFHAADAQFDQFIATLEGGNQS